MNCNTCGKRLSSEELKVSNTCSYCRMQKRVDNNNKLSPNDHWGENPYPYTALRCGMCRNRSDVGVCKYCEGTKG